MPTPEKPQKPIPPHECLGCQSFFQHLKLHLRSSEMCLGIYKEKYQSNDADDVMRKIKIKDGRSKDTKKEQWVLKEVGRIKIGQQTTNLQVARLPKYPSKLS